MAVLRHPSNTGIRPARGNIVKPRKQFTPWTTTMFWCLPTKHERFHHISKAFVIFQVMHAKADLSSMPVTVNHFDQPPEQVVDKTVT